MKDERNLAALNGATLAMCPRSLRIRHRRGPRAGISATAAEIQAIMTKKEVQRDQGGVYVLPLFGTISQRIGLMEQGLGRHVDRASATFDQAFADPQVGALSAAWVRPAASSPDPGTSRTDSSARGEKLAGGDRQRPEPPPAFWIATAFDKS